jgi:hypothetical protein
MEVQDGEYRDYEDDASKELNIDGSGLLVTIQQKGLNEFNANGTYARILVSAHVGNPGDYDSLTFDLDDYSQADIDELDAYFHSIADADVDTMADGPASIHIEDWYPFKLETVNGMSCFHLSYTRTVNGDEKPALVNSYIFQDDYRMITVTISYRIEDGQLWKTDLDYSLSTFRISG